MQYLSKNLYVILIVLIFSILLTWQNIFSTSANDYTYQQVREVNKEFFAGQVPELILTSEKMAKVAANKQLNLTIAFNTHHQEELRNLITELYDPNSPKYHKWLSPEEFGKKFGRSDAEINTAIEWLASQGFNIEQTWPNRLAISFSASVETVERVFEVEVNNYKDKTGRIFYSNNKLPKLPDQIAQFTSSIKGLNNAYVYRTNSKIKPFPSEEQKHWQDFVKKGKNFQEARVANSPIFFGPADFGLTYNITPLTKSGMQGQGQRVAIIIDSDVLDSDIILHRQLFNLPWPNLKRFVPPGLEKPSVQFQGEAELDIDSISLVAPMANIELVLIPELTTTNIFLAEQYIINTLKTPIVNESFGGCEVDVYDPAEQMLMLQGVAQGTAFFVAAGDEGAECFPGGTTGKAAINCPACYDGVTAVGGTQVIGDYDFSGNLKQVLQESVWNEPPGVRFDCTGVPFANGGGATGGGISEKVAQPTYQKDATGFTGGVPTSTKRSIPDISILAGTPGTAIVVDEGGFIVSGTSQSAPLWAGIMVLINQSKSTPQGSPNSEIYRLGKAEFRDGADKVFTDILVGNNNTMPRSPCTETGAKGFLASVGYDLATGWGIPNVALLVQNYGNIPDTVAPTVKVVAPSAGDMLKANQQFLISWQSQDNKTIASHNVMLSTDGGTTFPITIANNLGGDSQSFIWTVPSINTTQARISVTAIDQAGNKGVGINSNNFTINVLRESFKLNIDTTTQTVVAGNTASFAISSQGMNGFNSRVDLDAKVEPMNSSIGFILEHFVIPGQSAILKVNTASNTVGEFKLTISGTAKSSLGEQLSDSITVMVKVIQPDFSLVLDSPQLKVTRGQGLTIPIRIDRIANFTGKVTITAPDVNSLKLKFSTITQVTTGNSVSFSLKAKKSGPIGLQNIVFSGKDDLGRVRTVILGLTIE